MSDKLPRMDYRQHRFDEPDKALQPEQQREKDKASGPESPPPEKGTDAKEKTPGIISAI